MHTKQLLFVVEWDTKAIKYHDIMKIYHTLDWKSESWVIALALSILIMGPWANQFHRDSNSLFVMWSVMHILVKCFIILKIYIAKLIWLGEPYVP